jgi:DNA-binding IclR family transcriptional regulator
MGIDLRLSCSAAGHAWLMTLPEDIAIEYASHQGLGKPQNFGPNAPTSIKALLKMLDEHRKRGFSIIQDVYAPGMSSMAAPVQRAGEPTTGCDRRCRAFVATEPSAHAQVRARAAWPAPTSSPSAGRPRRC